MRGTRPSCPARKLVSFRLEDDVVTSAAYKEFLEEQSWQQTIFTPSWEVLLNVHWCHECDMGEEMVAKLHNLLRYDGKARCALVALPPCHAAERTNAWTCGFLLPA